MQTIAAADLAAFREFASQFDAALSQKDLGFLISLAELVSVTCVGDEQLGPCTGKPPGEVVTGIPGSAWRSDASGIFTDAEYVENLTRYIEHARGDLSDAQGTGALELFAIAEIASAGEYQLITTAIEDQHHTTGYPIEPPGRVALVFNFAARAGEFRFISERYAASAATAGDWLSGNCSQCYSYWEKWEG